MINILNITVFRQLSQELFFDILRKLGCLSRNATWLAAEDKLELSWFAFIGISWNAADHLRLCGVGIVLRSAAIKKSEGVGFSFRSKVR